MQFERADKTTSSATNLTSFVTTASGEEIVYTARNPVSTFLTESVSRKGIAVTNEDVTDLIRGSYGGKGLRRRLFVYQAIGEERETKIAIQGRIVATILRCRFHRTGRTS